MKLDRARDWLWRWTGSFCRGVLLDLGRGRRRGPPVGSCTCGAWNGMEGQAWVDIRQLMREDPRRDAATYVWWHAHRLMELTGGADNKWLVSALLALMVAARRSDGDLDAVLLSCPVGYHYPLETLFKQISMRRDPSGIITEPEGAIVFKDAPVEPCGEGSRPSGSRPYVSDLWPGIEKPADKWPERVPPKSKPGKDA